VIVITPAEGEADIPRQMLVLRPKDVVLLREASLEYVIPLPETPDGSVAFAGVTAPPNATTITSRFAVGVTLAVEADSPFVPLVPLVSEAWVIAIHSAA
jgi:hypothetical protein